MILPEFRIVVETLDIGQQDPDKLSYDDLPDASSTRESPRRLGDLPLAPLLGVEDPLVRM